MNQGELHASVGPALHQFPISFVRNVPTFGRVYGQRSFSLLRFVPPLRRLPPGDLRPLVICEWHSTNTDLAIATFGSTSRPNTIHTPRGSFSSLHTGSPQCSTNRHSPWWCRRRQRRWPIWRPWNTSPNDLDQRQSEAIPEAFFLRPHYPRLFQVTAPCGH